MKNIFYKLKATALLILAVLLQYSCQHDEIGPSPGKEVAVELFAQIGSLSQPQNRGDVITTRVSGNTFEADDMLGIYMLSENGSLPGGIINSYDNRRYRVASDGTASGLKLTPSSPEHAMFYPEDGANVKFVAYYPYLPTYTGSGETAGMIDNYVYPVDISEQGLNNVDLLYSNNGTGNNSTGATTLTFSHQLSKLVINLQQVAGMNDDLSSAYVTITGMPTKGTLSLTDAQFTIDAASIAPIVIGTNTKMGPIVRYDAIVIPHEGSAYTGRKITFSVGGTDYTWTMPDDIDFDKNKEYTCSFTIRGRELAFTGVTVSDWTDGVDDLIFPVSRIPAGKFWMGSSDGTKEITFNGTTFTPDADPWRNPMGRESPLHEVQITKDFYMSKYEVTNAQYCLFLNSLKDDSNFSVEKVGTLYQAFYTTDEGKVPYVQECNHSHAYSNIWGMKYNETTKEWGPNPHTNGIDYSDYPAVYVTWHGANAFCKWVQGRLPTEAEWEYACYGGLYFIGNAPVRHISISTYSLSDYAWCGRNNNRDDYVNGTIDGYRYGTKPVGKKLPNKYGLYDMIGNVYEWCNDWYSSTYYSEIAGSLAVDPQGPASAEVINEMEYRSARGQAFTLNDVGGRTAERGTGNPVGLSSSYGFRVLFEIDPNP